MTWQDAALGAVGIVSLFAVLQGAFSAKSRWPRSSSILKIGTQAAIVSVNISLGYPLSSAIGTANTVAWVYVAIWRAT